MTRSRAPAAYGAIIVAVAAAAALAYFATRSSGQPRVSADVIPLVAGAHRVATYVDCSQIGAVAYDANNPCQTFVLVGGNESKSAAALLVAEARQLVRSGWRHSVAQPVDYDGGSADDVVADRSESWVAADRRVCAYVATAAAGATAEAKDLFPYDPYNQPRGVLDFYRKGAAAERTPTLWVRLEPNAGGPCVEG